MMYRVETGQEVLAWTKPQCGWRSWAADAHLEHQDECDLAFRWQHCRDRKCLTVLLRSFEPLLYGMASERFQTSQLEKGVKVVDRSRAANNYELADNFQELMAVGREGLVDAANRYEGRFRFETYARPWVFKRMQEYVRFNWHVVRMPVRSLETRNESRNHRWDRPHRSQACNQAPVGRTPRRGGFAIYRG